MAIVLTDDQYVTLDESSGLQTSGTPAANEDNNDNDIVYTDLPAAFATRLFDAGQLSLSNTFALANGAARNDFISLTEGSTLTGFVMSNGDPLPVYDASGPTDPTTGVLASFTTVDGEAIYLFADMATGGGLGAFMFLGVDASGEIVLAGHLQSDGTISTVQFEAITNPDSGDHDDPVDLSGLLDVAASGTIEFDFNTLPSGNNLFDILGPSPTDPAIIILGENILMKEDGSLDSGSDRIFTSQAATGDDATIGMNNQMFNPGDAAFFVYIEDPVASFLSGWPDGLDSTEADDADNIQYNGGTLDVTSAKFTISQIQGNSTGSLSLTTYLGNDDQGRTLASDPSGGGASPNIILVKVTVGGTTYEFDSDADAAQAGVDVSGLGTATVTISGVDDGHAIEFFTDDLHNRVKIEGVEGKFDIGGFAITQGITIHEPVGDRIVFEDDGPVVGDGEGTPGLTVDDSDFVTDDSVSYANLFDVDFGTDGGKDADNDGTVDDDAVAYTLGISGDGDDSGLVDTLSGEAVLLHLDGDDVIGTTAIGGDEVFRISVNVDTGEVTLDQSRAVVHDDPEDPEEDGAGEPSKLTSADLITLTATATDDDGDTDDHTVGIGDTFSFEDDGPTNALSEESVPGLVTDDTDTPTSSDSADFSVLFNPDFGNDEEGDPAATYALGVSGIDADSGLIDTLTGETVVLNLDGNDVVGTSATGGEVLRISVDDTGTVTLTQLRAVVHDNPGDPSESTEPSTLSAANLVTLIQTVYDGDGDHDDATADIGLAFNFEDDGPTMDLATVDPPSLTTDDTEITDSDTASYAGLFDADFGKDGEASVGEITYALGVSGSDADSGLTDTLTGEAVLLNLDGDDVVGTSATGGEVLRISVDADGNVTLQQSRAVVHDDPEDPEEDGADEPSKFSAASLVTLTAVAYDGDGDHDDAIADIGLTFNFLDDGPSIERNAEPAPTLTVDETVFGFANADFSGLFTTLYGNDGPKDEDGNDLPDDDAITYELSISGAGDDTGLVDSLTGDSVLLGLDGLDVIGVTAIGGLEVFRVSADENTGEVTFTQSRAVKHDDPLDPDESTSPAVLSSPDLVQLTATAHDGDGDHGSATIDIGGTLLFEDDGPAIGDISSDIVDFSTSSSVSNPLGAVPGNDGASVKITDFTPSVDLGFTTVTGVQEDDQTVVYYENTNGNGTIGDAGDTAFFQLALDDSDPDPANWNYVFDVLQDPNLVNIDFDFDNLPSGANLFGVVGESATDPAIIVFGKNPVFNAAGNYTNKSDVIHTSQGGTGATIGVNNQMFDAKDAAYFVYVDDPVANYLSGVPGGLTATEADDADNVQYTGGTVDVHTASITVSQTQAGPKVLAGMKITTWLGDPDQGRDLLNDPTSGGPSPDIVLVRVFVPGQADPIEFDADADPAVMGIDVSGLGTATVTVTGLKNGYTIEWTTDDLHNRALIEATAGKFDVGKFAISESTTAPDAELNFEVTIEDFDFNGDTAVDDFTIGIDGDHDGNVIV
ncbi:DUF5801 repeats-in-toxin domain-containing protein [Devosia sp. CN2-171]|uniref:DUF5801 repeats-in-toxin domain-containing protein n=1 Tax=Devosia sp. CN2-171 TaxID=3400909 RepID=UPI003BF88EB3